MSVLFQQRCDLYRKSATPGRLGGDSAELTLVRAKAKCTYVAKAERVLNTAASQTSQVMIERLFVPLNVEVGHDWVVQNIAERRGRVIEPGPFLIETVTPDTHLGGAQIYQVLKLKRSYA